MTVQEVMERAGVKETTLTIAWIKDAIHLIRSQQNERLETSSSNIIDGIREYPLPANMIKLKSISVKDTNDDKYKRIRRLVQDPVVSEDNSPD
jgi:hypothetical protein